MSETLSFNQITEQQENGQPATVLVDRSGGKISTGIYAGANPEKPGTYMVNVTTEKDGRLISGYREVSADAVSDVYQERLAEQLAGKGLRISVGHAAMPAEVAQAMSPGFIDRVPGSVRNQTVAAEGAQAAPERTNADRITELSAKIDEMVKDFSKDDVAKLYNFARYSADKEEAQQSKDGAASTLYGQYMGQELRAMSPAAKAISSEFRDALRHLQWLRDQ